MGSRPRLVHIVLQTTQADAMSELITRAWALSGPELPDPMTVLIGAS